MNVTKLHSFPTAVVMNKLKADDFRQHLFNYFIVVESEVLSHFHRGEVKVLVGAWSLQRL